MSAEQMNGFLRLVARDKTLQRQLRTSDAAGAAELAVASGFRVTVADLTRYKARSTSWKLSDRELEVVAAWQVADQPFWWQYIWPE
jgi:predicted ribosomally synthesized peptide with nif11-like leader